MLAGWCLYQEVWPRLVMRIIQGKLKVPQMLQWAMMDPTQKWNNRGFYDLHNIYTQGAYGRPKITLEQALGRWTGRAVPDEFQLSRMTGADLKASLADILDGMREVVHRYG
jgi:hypothetical protein